MISSQETKDEQARRQMRRSRSDAIRQQVNGRERDLTNRLFLDAVDRGHEEEIKKLVNAGEPKYIGHRGVTSLHVAGYPSVARTVLKR